MRGGRGLEAGIEEGVHQCGLAHAGLSCGPPLLIIFDIFCIIINTSYFNILIEKDLTKEHQRVYFISVCN